MFSGLRSLQGQGGKLPVHDRFLVAVVDAVQHLLHEHSRFFLCELSARDDFVEEFAALADPRTLRGIKLTP